MTKPLLYLAGPYRHDLENVRIKRFNCLSRAAGRLVNLGYNVYSPISHNHPMTTHVTMSRDWEFWKRYDTVFLDLSYKLVVLTLEGWDTSIGVTDEIQIARSADMPVVFLPAFYSNFIVSEDTWHSIKITIGD